MERLIRLSLAVTTMSLSSVALSTGKGGGITLRAAVHPNVDDSQDTISEAETNEAGGVETTEERTTETEIRSSASHLNVGAGYTFDTGLHLGASMWQEESTFRYKEKDVDTESGVSDGAWTLK